MDRDAVADTMICAMAAEITDGDLVGVGLGTPLAVAAGLLARATTAPDAHLLVGGAVDPRADLATCLEGARSLVGRTAGFVPHLDTMGMAEQQSMTLQYLRPAQVDGRGNLNTSWVRRGEGRVRLPGGLATADVPRLLPRLVIYLPTHRRRSLPARVDVVTGTGGGWAGGRHRSRGVVTLVTDMAVIRFTAEGAVLASTHPGVEVRDVVDTTGFDLLGVTSAGTTPTPSTEAHARLEELDPHGVRGRELE